MLEPREGGRVGVAALLQADAGVGRIETRCELELRKVMPGKTSEVDT
jgi:hypothetical protein